VPSIADRERRKSLNQWIISVPSLGEAQLMMDQVRKELKAHAQQLEDSRKITEKDLQARFR
jgi:hypothetical protein